MLSEHSHHSVLLACCSPHNGTDYSLARTSNSEPKQTPPPLEKEKKGRFSSLTSQKLGRWWAATKREETEDTDLMRGRKKTVVWPSEQGCLMHVHT